MTDKNPVGRPSDYQPEYAKMAEEIIRHSGFSIPKIAKVFSVSRATVYNWMAEHQEFLDGIKNGRKIFEGQQIHRSLVKRAVGFRFTEVTKEAGNDGTLKTTKKVTKYYPPDVAAIKHWQVNMDQANWADRREVDLGDTAQRLIERLNNALGRENDGSGPE